MTFLWRDPDNISNWFNGILDGVGHRGSSFTDVDWMAVRAVTHDGYSRRFLFQEFKRPGEECSAGQWWYLYDLARQPRTTVWLAQQCEGLTSIELTTFHEVPAQGLLTAETLSIEAYRQRFADWWNQSPLTKVDDGIPDRLIWAEYVKRDPSLQAFIAGELARERMATETAIHERDHWQQVARRLSERFPARRSTRAKLAAWLPLLRDIK